MIPVDRGIEGNCQICQVNPELSATLPYAKSSPQVRISAFWQQQTDDPGFEQFLPLVGS
jgi:hypothetical protein